MILWAIAIAFVLTQCSYALTNASILIFCYVRRANLVTTATLDRLAAEEPPAEADRSPIAHDGGTSLGENEVGPGDSDAPTLPERYWRPIHVLVPIYGEREAVLAETIAAIYDGTYPSSLVSVHVIYESDDVGAPAALECVPAFRDRGYDVSAIEVDRNALAADRSPGEWVFTDSFVPKTKAAALTYAFMALSFDADDVITVFDSDTQVAPDTFELAIAGLREYDVVQAKQTVRNHGDGFLPLLEAMGIAAWSDVIYAKTAKGPYQLLGKAYFTEARVLQDLDKWQLDAATEDMALGMAAYSRGYTLGVLDRYVQDLCPADLRAWVGQKRRWVRGPYEHLLAPGLSPLERARFWGVTVANQLMSVTNVVGLPVGLCFLALVLAGRGVPVSSAVWPIVLANTVSWAYYSVRSYGATREGVRFADRRERYRFYLLSNPLAQALYAALWAIPISLAIADVVRGREATFIVTPKE